MKLLRATFLSVNGLRDVTCDFSRTMQESARDVVVITGAPASGKTRVIEAILAAKEVIAPYGPPIHSDPWIRPGDDAAKVALTFLFDEEEQRRIGGIPAVMEAEALFNMRGANADADEGLVALVERYGHDPRHGKLDYFAANRWLPPPGPMHGLGAIEQRLYRLGRDARKYSFVPRLLAEIVNDAEKQARFRTAIERLSPTLRYVGPPGTDPLRCFSSRGGYAATPSELSTSEQDAVVFAATSVHVRHEKSVVFIDRPELFVGERGIVAWMEAVRGLADDVQIIVASTSPALLASMEPGAVINLEA
ncbi:ATP-binding protein [Chondromyces apiculatus]|uniref:ATPase AAA-type core domain-containing protein n=1 Tax=Chondromyces apiculatus DSM 436 TaxID=1192034 RepID=A0A017THR4_9BACT|nr:ATP-binding protein [Chondromyces apiculatus]EYF08794.1 Hypothetical protein CAP_2655 [Chondromyces apiculatus DSM 436]